MRQPEANNPRVCQLICFTRKHNLGARLRQINTTGKSVKTCPANCVKIFRFRSRPNHRHNSARLTRLRGARDRHERVVRCDGRGWRAGRARRMRTAKSCGSDVAVLALRSGEAKLLWDNGGKRAVLREEHEVSRKAIAQGRPECSRCPVCSCAVFVCANRTRDRGCSKHPVFPAPSVFEEGKRDANLGRNASRDRESVFS